MVLQAREYELAKKYLGDPRKRLSAATRNFREGMIFAKSSKSGDASRQAFERIYTNEVVRIIVILRETRDENVAKDIQADALKKLESSEIRNALKK